jgi:hypothetical protein
MLVLGESAQMRNIQRRKKELAKHIGSADQTNELGKRLNHCNTTELIACGILREKGKIRKKMRSGEPACKRQDKLIPMECWSHMISSNVKQ